jgi:hypothetical protein
MIFGDTLLRKGFLDVDLSSLEESTFRLPKEIDRRWDPRAARRRRRLCPTGSRSAPL